MKKIFYIFYFRGGVALKSHPGVCFTHAIAVVNHLYQCLAGIFYHQLYFRGTGIHCIFQEFLYDGEDVCPTPLLGSATRN